ncbi:Glycosyltransferase involved in cell wall bisynthesis [Clostridium amylolyticum]|uniref:Glycosyltransferase involved in cell wall bisynthesis n=1 Tax=Clostridium amylolyticum TaxID=1121298 RepID=A0A1M6NRX2_9CLOT|nr:glycosyltransferase family 4 protein [Clostridium amylolyticum]SHJ98471.1 Glycosyltransferase involved in cell wall bisynthesis [Clostridium amylolyticum]
MKEIRIVQLTAIESTMNTMLYALNKGILKEGYSLTALYSPSETSDEIVRDRDINVVNVEIERKIAPISNIRCIYKIYKELKKIKPHIVHVHTPIAAVLGRIAAKLAKVPIIIYTAHGFYFHENMSPLTYKLFYNIEKFMGKYFTDFLFTQSLEDYETAIKGKFKPKDKILAIGNGVDGRNKFNIENIQEQDIKNLRSEFNIGEKDKVVTFIGRLVEEKGILDLLKAFEKIERDDIKLLIVGRLEKGERDTKTFEALKKYYNKKNIIFTGRREDINNILYITDIFCLPSYREGMPRSIIEAMVMECAVIASDIRGCREEVVQDNTGYLIKVNSPEFIKEKIELLCEDEEMLNAMKKQGRARALQLYNEEKVVQKQLEVYKVLLKSKVLGG